jgi:hypothetical protein
MRPDDWDRLFAPNAYRRGGPLQALVNILIAILFVVAVGGGAIFVSNYSNRQRALASANATAVAATAAPIQTATARIAAQATATRFAIQTATALARQAPQPAQATPEPVLGIGVVTRGGNLRSEPVVADNTVIGLIWAGDEITFLERRQVADQTWFRVRLTRSASDRSGAGVDAGISGWVSSLLLSGPTPAPTP